MKNKKMACLFFLFSSIGHGFYFTKNLIKVNNDIPSEWVGEISLLIGISYFLSFSLLRTAKSQTFSLLIIILKGAFLILMGFPSGNFIGFEHIIILTLLLEIGFYLRFPTNICISFLFILFIFSIQTNNQTYLLDGNIFSFPSQYYYFLFLPFAIVVVLSLMTFYREQLIKKSKMVEIQEKMINQLSEVNLGYQEYMFVLEEQSIMNERKRVSRELHDIVGYLITNIIMMMQAAMEIVGDKDEQLNLLLKKVEDHAQEGYQEVRQSLRLLRSLNLRKIKGIPAIQKLINTFSEATNVQVSIDYGNILFSFGGEIENVLYRLIQEGMINAFMHGKATEIQIKIWHTEKEIQLSIYDNGIGTSEIHEGIGFSGMKERISNLHGTFEANNMYEGFKIYATIPFIPEKLKNEC